MDRLQTILRLIVGDYLHGDRTYWKTQFRPALADPARYENGRFIGRRIVWFDVKWMVTGGPLTRLVVNSVRGDTVASYPWLRLNAADCRWEELIARISGWEERNK